MNRRYLALKALTRVAPDFWAKQVSQPIFILGCARSGTSLLATLLGLHHDVGDWSEANEVWDPTGHPWRRSARETPPVWVDPEAFMRRWWRDAQPRQQEIRAVFGAYLVLKGKARLSNKSPYNTLRIPQVLRFFPDAKLINIVRDGRAVVHSYVRRELNKIRNASALYDQPYIPHSPEQVALRLAEFWKYNVDEVERQAAALDLAGRNLILELTYEQLCGDTPGTLERISRFAGLDVTRFDARVRTTATPSQNNKWQTELDPTLIKQLVEVMQPALARYNYL